MRARRIGATMKATAKILALGALLALLAACQSGGSSAGLPVLTVNSIMTADNLCSLGVSPAIEIARAPSATARYRVRFQNVGVLFSEAQNFEIDATTRSVPQGALEAYRGVCPGERQRFEIRIEVLAVDAQGRALAYGSTNRSVTSTTSMLRAPRPEQ
jgi:hypothetical protein